LLEREFLREFRDVTQAKWREKAIDRKIYGFQFQKGTRWNPGLTEEAIREYERALRALFPDDLRSILREMNGTDLPTLNVYGFSRETHRESVGVYSYAKHIDIVNQRIEDIRANCALIVADLRKPGFDLSNEASLVPFYEHRFVVCRSDLRSSEVLSIETAVASSDSIVSANSLLSICKKSFYVYPGQDTQ
jgi:hypothetical protein